MDTPLAPTFNIRRFEGPYVTDQHDPEAVAKQSLNKDFSGFIDKDAKLRRAYAQLRHLAIVLFVCAVISLAIAVADIEITRKARTIISANLDCQATYSIGWSRYCPALSYGSNSSHYLNTSDPQSTYFKRWLVSHLTFARHRTIVGICLKSSLTLITIVIAICMVGYHQAELDVLRMKRYLPEDSSFWKSPEMRSFAIKFVMVCFHIPPLFDAWIQYELQLLVLFRTVICGVKMLKECNELRYHRLGNVLSNLAHVNIHTAFLIKTYFLRYPKFILFIVYLTVVGFFPYLVIITECVEGHNLEYLDACWLMVVTITNLGSGEVRPRGIPARIVVGLGSMIGILSTALWVNVFSKYLDIPSEERRILSLVELQRCRRVERDAAATCIQATWMRYSYRKRCPGDIRGCKEMDKMCKKTMWAWKGVRQNCSKVRRNLETNFSTEDTLIVARRMARRMSEYRMKPIIINQPSVGMATRRNSLMKTISNTVTSHFKKPNRLSIFPVEDSLEEDDAPQAPPLQRPEEKRTKTEVSLQPPLKEWNSFVSQLCRVEATANSQHSAMTLRLNKIEQNLGDVLQLLGDIKIAGQIPNKLS